MVSGPDPRLERTDRVVLAGLALALALTVGATVVLTLRWQPTSAGVATGGDAVTRADLLASPAGAEPLAVAVDPEPGSAVGGGEVVGQLLTVASFTDADGPLVLVQGTLPQLGQDGLAIRGPAAAGSLQVLRANRIPRDLPDGSRVFDGVDILLAATSPVAPFDLCLWQPATGRIVAGSTQRVCLGLDSRADP